MLKLNLGININLRPAKAVMSYADINKAIGYPAAYPAQIDMQDFAFDDNIGTRLLLGSRDYGKTDYITILGCIKRLYDNNNYAILIICKEAARAANILAEISKGLRSIGVSLCKDAAREIKIKGSQGKEPSCAVLSVRSQSLRGRHPDMILMDDVVTLTDTGEAERKRVQAMYEEAFKLTGNICLIGQPVHKLDLYQKLRKLIPTALYPYGSMPERDKDINIKAQSLAGVSDASIQASYYLNIIDDNSLPFAQIQQIQDFNASQCVAYVDPSHKGKDYTAIVVAGVFMQQLQVAGFALKKAWHNCIDEMVTIFSRYNVQTTAIETNGVGDIAVLALRDKGLSCVGVHNTIPKHRRIAAVALYVNDFRLHAISNDPLAQSNYIFNQQVIDYSIDAKNDDAPDAIAGVTAFCGLIKIS